MPRPQSKAVSIHPTADVSSDATIGAGTKIWNQSQIRERAVIGSNVIVGKNVYIDLDVRVGSNCKIQNNVSIYTGVVIEDGVFIGPHVCFTNDIIPRAINVNGRLKTTEDWHISSTLVRYGASIGAHSVVLPGTTIGRFAMVGAGSVVTRDVHDHTLVVGNPARVIGFVCRCGFRLMAKENGLAECSMCGEKISIEN